MWLRLEKQSWNLDKWTYLTKCGTRPLATLKRVFCLAFKVSEVEKFGFAGPMCLSRCWVWVWLLRTKMLIGAYSRKGCFVNNLADFPEPEPLRLDQTASECQSG